MAYPSPARAVRRAVILVAAIALLAIALPFRVVAQDEQGVDDGTALTMWSRAATDARSRQIVDAYNATHQNQIELTIIETDTYQATVAAAAGSNTLPDIMSADVVFMPNWTSAGLFTDLTDRIDAMPNLANIAPAHIEASTWDGKKYGLPFVMDLSVWMWNKDIYERAGLDPEKGPTSLKEFEDHARAIAQANLTTADGTKIHGTSFGGNCGCCMCFTLWPVIWASGEQVMNAEGTEATLNGPACQEVYSTMGRLYADGSADPFSNEETGPTWTRPFQTGLAGVMPMPATFAGILPEVLPHVGVTPIAGVDGGQSTFVGGDSVGISKDSQHADQAWNFLSWMQGEEAQVEVVAKNGNVVSRTDLADNQYSAADPRLVTFNEVASVGVTPFALKFGATYNDPQGPWLAMARNAIFGDGSTIDADNDAVTASLQ
jgi:multiple sugar transport system substrate-binding protein